MGLLLFKFLLVVCWISFFVGAFVGWKNQRHEDNILFRAIVAFTYGLVPVGGCFILAFMLMLFVDAIQWTLAVLSS